MSATEIKLTHDELTRMINDLWKGRPSGGPHINLSITWVNPYAGEVTLKLSRRNLKFLKRADVMNHLKRWYREKLTR